MSEQNKDKQTYTVDTLITTMGLADADSLVKKMNVQGNYIIGNQCDYNSVENREHGVVVSTDMRGVGLNRNCIIERSSADICVLADDDMVFCDGYVSIVQSCFDKYADADMIIFNFRSESEGRRVTKKAKKIGLLNYMNYGAARIAFRRKRLMYRSVWFTTMFGGGTPHQCGEDSLFIRSCLRAGLKVIVVPEALASLSEERESTWFKGYNEKYFFDKGVFLGIAHPRVGKLFARYLVLRHKEYSAQSGMSGRKIYRCILRGIKSGKKA